MREIAIAAFFITLTMALFGIYYFENVVKPPLDCSKAIISYQDFVSLHKDKCEDYGGVATCVYYYREAFCPAKSKQ